MSDYDYVIVGGGIIGLTVAYELTERFPEARIALIEKEPFPGQHASGRNSGVLHSGIYYSSDTLKARMCADGARLMKEFAGRHGIPCRTCGKVIIATKESDLKVLERLMRNARDNGVKAELKNQYEIRQIEPHAKPFYAGIYTPDTAVIDSSGILNALREILTTRKTALFFGMRAVSIDPGIQQIQTDSGNIRYSFLFNCAGAYADEIARFFGFARTYALVPFKGIYYELSADKRFMVNGNIYPVPDIEMPFLGIHFTKSIDGRVYVGPTAVPAFGREHYGILKGLNWREGGSIAGRVLSMYLCGRDHFRGLAHREMLNCIKSFFVRNARKLLPEIGEKDFVRSEKVGIRPQLINTRTNQMVMDYVLENDQSSVHVLNAISPAFTCSFAFAKLLADKAAKISKTNTLTLERVEAGHG